ncbi:NAD(P)H-binding protein [Modestobacter sp. VKM Ac-2977]|uniref:SDR family oxidoreductase n=1 Tax=Modestobacter sp. VKM Ac-2977 TaxID=3004131 RepID=UPI0022AB1FF1|nr:NmrA family NAD(P)-binding protein [Modestobacter sp. VKM Ac-2977]MCZ2821292.1 NAD(P)H-binding protein [Modestobacter sp. VKM Ac-2977]
MIVVTAAGGPTGTAVVRALRARGESVRAVVSSRGPRPELTELGAEVVVAELSSPMAWSSVFQGADAMYLIWPNFDPDEAEGAAALFAEARRAGLPRVVYHSVMRPQLRVMPHHAGKDLAEEALDSSGLTSWRVLQPCSYADNLDTQLESAQISGVLRSFWGLRTAQSMVDLRDVAEAAAVLLTEDGLDGGTFEAAGPEALTAPRLAELIGEWLGDDVVADDVIPGGEVPTGYAARCQRTMFDHYRAHGFVGSPRVLTDLLGRPPRTFAEHLADLPRPGEPAP